MEERDRIQENVVKMNLGKKFIRFVILDTGLEIGSKDEIKKVSAELAFENLKSGILEYINYLTILPQNEREMLSILTVGNGNVEVNLKPNQKWDLIFIRNIISQIKLSHNKPLYSNDFLDHEQAMETLYKYILQIQKKSLETKISVEIKVDYFFSRSIPTSEKMSLILEKLDPDLIQVNFISLVLPFPSSALDINHSLASLALFLRTWENIKLIRQEMDSASLSKLFRSWIPIPKYKTKIFFSEFSFIECVTSPVALDKIRIKKQEVCLCHKSILNAPSSTTSNRCSITGKLLDPSDTRMAYIFGENTLSLIQNNGDNFKNQASLKYLQFEVQGKVNWNEINIELIYGSSFRVEEFLNLTNDLLNLDAQLFQQETVLILSSSQEIETFQYLPFNQKIHFLLIPTGKGSCILKNFYAADQILPLNERNMNSNLIANDEKTIQMLQKVPSIESFNPLLWENGIHTSISNIFIQKSNQTNSNFFKKYQS